MTLKTQNLNGSENRECVAIETGNQKWYFKEKYKSCVYFMRVIYQISNNFSWK
jgi:hypothetical protein